MHDGETTSIVHCPRSCRAVHQEACENDADDPILIFLGRRFKQNIDGCKKPVIMLRHARCNVRPSRKRECPGGVTYTVPRCSRTPDWTGMIGMQVDSRSQSSNLKDFGPGKPSLAICSVMIRVAGISCESDLPLLLDHRSSSLTPTR